MFTPNERKEAKSSFSNRWSAARAFLAVSAVYLLIVGVVGFFLDASFPTAAAEVNEGHAHVFGVFETNGWHNLAAVVLGLASLVVAFWITRLSAPLALVSGIGNGIFFLAFELWDPATFWFASNTADQVVHALTAVAGIATGVMSYRSVTEPGRLSGGLARRWTVAQR